MWSFFFDIYYIGNFHVKWILGQVLIKFLKFYKTKYVKGDFFNTKQPFILLTIQTYKKRKRIICLKIWPQKPETKLDCQWSSYIKDKEITSHCYENKIWKVQLRLYPCHLKKSFFNIGVHCMISVILCLFHLCLHGTCIIDNSFILDLFKI